MERLVAVAIMGSLVFACGGPAPEEGTAERTGEQRAETPAAGAAPSGDRTQENGRGDRAGAGGTADRAPAGERVELEPAFALPIPDLLPEGIARDPRDGTLYVSSVRHRTILRLAADGTPTGEAGADGRFVEDGAHGLSGTVGLRVDTGRDLLWVASARAAPTLGDPADGEMAGVFAFRLADGGLEARYPTPPGGEHVVNDIVVTPDGRVLATDTSADAVWEVREGAAELAVFGRSRAIAGANGLAVSPDGEHLYVAHRKGIARLPLDGSAGAQLSGGDLAGVDGLYAVAGGLLGVQNQGGRERISLFRLAPDGVTVTATDVLADGLPFFDTPTTCAIGEGTAWCIASSHLLSPLEELEDLEPSTVLELPLGGL